MRRASRSARAAGVGRRAVSVAAALAAAAGLALAGCGSDSSSAKTTTTVVAGAEMRLPDDATILQVFGADAAIERSPEPVRGGVVDRACGGGSVPLRTREALGIQSRPAGSPQVEINMVLMEFPSAGTASGYFTSYAFGRRDCEWKDTSGQKRRLDDVAQLADVGGARQLQVRLLAGDGTSTIETVLLRGATVADVGARPATAGAAARAVAQIATLLTR